MLNYESVVMQVLYGRAVLALRVSFRVLGMDVWIDGLVDHIPGDAPNRIGLVYSKYVQPDLS